MTLAAWPRCLKKRSISKQARRPSFRLFLESLENRTLPSTFTFTVDTTADTDQAVAGTDPHDSSGHISLRSAIEAANQVSGSVTINFNIPTSDSGFNIQGNPAGDQWWTIALTSDLPVLAAPDVTIDGLSQNINQPGFNTNSIGTTSAIEAANATVGLDGHTLLHPQAPEIALDAAGLNGLIVLPSAPATSTGITIDGLSIYDVQTSDTAGILANYFNDYNGMGAALALGSPGPGGAGAFPYSVNNMLIGALPDGTQPAAGPTIVTGSVTSGSATITGLSSTTGLFQGEWVAGPDIYGQIQSIGPGSQITLNAQATASNSAEILRPFGQRDAGFGILIDGPGKWWTISQNYVGWSGFTGIDASAPPSGDDNAANYPAITVEDNEVLYNGWDDLDQDGIDIDGVNSTVMHNLSYGNGNDNVSTAVISQASESGGLVTINANQSFVPGNPVIISGIATSGYNGTFTVVSATGSSFTYNDTVTGLATDTGGGIAAVPIPNGTSGAGVELGSTGTGTTAIVANDFVQNNTLIDNASAGVESRKGNLDNTIQGNIISGNYVGISVRSEGGRNEYGNQIAQNSIYGNTSLGIDLNGNPNLVGSIAATLTGAVVAGSYTVTGLSSTAALSVGESVSGPDVNSTIASIDSATQITLNDPASGTNASEPLTFVYTDLDQAPPGLAFDGLTANQLSSLTAVLSSGSNTISGITTVGGLFPGEGVSGNGIQAGTTITAATGAAFIASATEAGNTVTIVTETAENFAVGQSITISGVNTPAYNGTFTIASVISGTTFTYTDNNASNLGPEFEGITSGSITLSAAATGSGSQTLTFTPGTSVSNLLQAYPILSQVSTTSNSITIPGTLQSTPNTSFTIEFYAGSTLDSSGSAEGQNYLGSLAVTTDSNGFVSFSTTLPYTSSQGTYITATATGPGSPNTSEFAPTIAVGAPLNPTTLSGTVYRDANNNGRIDLGDSGIGGVTVKLLDANNNVVSTVTTAPNGSYSFTNVPAGASYRIVEVQPAVYLDGKDTPGSGSGITNVAVSNDIFTVHVGPAGNFSGSGYNFGEVAVAATATSTASATFKSDSIATGNTLWLSSVVAMSGLTTSGQGTVVLRVVNASVTITTTSPTLTYTIPVPNALIRFENSVTYATATTTFDAADNVWLTTGGKTTGNYLLSALPWTVPAGNLASASFKWTATFLVDTANVHVSSWQAAAAVYNTTSPPYTIPSDFNLIEVKPTDSSTAPAPYNNTDRAGTPELFKTKVIAGALGIGGVAYTGGYTPNPSPDPTPAIVPNLYPIDPTETFQTTAVVPELAAGSSVAVGLSNLLGANDINNGRISVALNLPTAEASAAHRAINSLNRQLHALGVKIVVVSSRSAHAVHIQMASSTTIGGVPQGVLGAYTLGGNITMVSGWKWYYGSNPGGIDANQYDFQTVVTHEIGHLLGLGENSDTTSPMDLYLTPGTIRRTLTTADLSTIQQELPERR